MSTLSGTTPVPAQDVLPAPVLRTTEVMRSGVKNAKRIRNLNLRRHLREIARAKRVISSMPVACAALFQAVESHSSILTDIHPTKLPVVPVLLRAAAYADYFIRPLDAWRAPPDKDPATQLRDLLSYLFDLWPVPAPFAEAWFTHGPLLHQEREWYIHLARGGSIRRMPCMPPMRRAAATMLPDAPGSLKGSGVVRWAQLRSMNCPEAVIDAVFTSNMAGDFANDSLWLPLIEKAAASRDFLPEQFGLITDGFQHLVRQAGMRRAEQLIRLPWTELASYWKRHWLALLDVTLALQNPAPTDQSLIYRPSARKQMMRIAARRWEPVRGIVPWESGMFGSQSRPLTWSIRELLSHSELIGEGRNMHHCVGTYAGQCMTRRSAIFRLRCTLWRKEAARRWGMESGEDCTIELALPSRRIIQCRIRRNRLPGEHTMAVIREWARHFKLTIR